MTREEITKTVKEIVVEQLGVNYNQVTEDASFFDDLGCDSLDAVELIMSFEEEYAISIPEDDADKIKKVGDAIDYLYKILKDVGNPST